MPASSTTEDRTYQDRQVTPVYTRNLKATKTVVVNVGGADSSKSYSLAQLFIGKLVSEKNKTFLICRKTRPALKLTAYRLVIDLLKQYGYFAHMTHNKSDLTLTVKGLNNFLVFASIDDPEKYKSAEFNYIWMEEANDFTWEDFIILKLRNRAKTVEGEPNRMYLTCNPSDVEGMVVRVLKEPDSEEIHSTYLDNKFASETDIAVLEGLREQDEAYWLIYAKGKFAKLKGQIHELVMWGSGPYPECEEYINGLDFGFVNPNELLKIGVDMEHMTLYVTELIWASGMTNADLAKEMKKVILEEDRGQEIYADSAEPARIEELYHEGFNIHGADKEKKSVLNGIDAVNRFKIVSREENVNFNTEMKGYKRKVDRKGIVQEEPVKFRDHGPNALRYAVYTHLRDRLLALDPAWTLHSGQEEEKPEGEEAVSVPVSDEQQTPDPVALAATRGARDDRKEDVEQDESDGGATPIGETPRGNKKPEPKKKAREDEDWTV